ncbi:SnoaL-like domain [Legionella busanensis]|uniref:SnoaL-like domain n=1 Tax=Legionella busanensis TaxID=190655 RepID=A0A378JLR5_9GAMM|nr:nuclear transport factor 2 family protein [Legionella busanensis]STX52154.1 SnoaL-like domain [Legionella busanensis]
MINRKIAWQFALDWLDAWNKHDVDLIMTHYADAIEFCSPVVQKVLGDERGIVQGKDNLRDYFTKQLKKFSTLHFQLLDVFTSPKTIVIYYKINRGLLASEVMLLDDKMKAIKVYANYDKDDVG